MLDYLAVNDPKRSLDLGHHVDEMPMKKITMDQIEGPIPEADRKELL